MRHTRDTCRTFNNQARQFFGGCQDYFMKTILTVLAVAGLSGCAVYPVPAYEQPYGASPVYGAPPAVIYGSGVYRQGGYIDAPPPVYVRPPPPRIIVQPAPQVLVQPGQHPQAMVARPGHGPGHRGRDQDRDGTRDRVDRDRDGDGVPNRADRWPNDPRLR
jgi:hypothetical protein